MANTYTSLHYHLIFSTKNRVAYLTPEIEQRVRAYIGGVARHHNKMTPEQWERVERLYQELRKDRQERHQTAKDLLIDLKSFREELAFAAKLESSGRADRTEPVTAQAEIIPTSHVPAAPTTSSAKIILGEIKRHKLGVFIALLIFVSVAAGIDLYLYLQKTEAPIDSIAVLPFTNQNRVEETEYLADGLTESIIKTGYSMRRSRNWRRPNESGRVIRF